jgi:hypothetical protein
MASARLPDYLGFGLASARPATPVLSAGCLGLYFATDTTAWSVWTGSSWGPIATGAAAADHGAVINSGTVQINNAITLAGTAAGTLAISPGSGTSDVMLNMPTGGGTVTATSVPAFPRQRMLWDVKQGATFGVLNLGTVFHLNGGITSFTLTPTNNATDRLEWLSPDGTIWVPLAINQGFTI